MKPTDREIQKKLGLLWEKAAVGGALLVVAVLVAYWWIPSGPGNGPIIESPQTAHASLPSDLKEHDGHGDLSMDQNQAGLAEESGHTRYACPMMCVPPTDSPGRCPVCGMALTPVHSQDDTTAQSRPHLRLPATSVHLAEIQTAPVVRRAVTNEVRLFGRIDYDSAHITQITAFMPGVVDRVYVKRAGQFVRWGDPLFDIYSSDLLETQRQLVDAMQFVPSFLSFHANTPHVAQDVPVQVRKRNTSGQQVSSEQKDALQKIKALRHKLSILGLPKRDIDEFMKKGEATGIATVYAPMYGQVTVQQATEGTFINTGTSLFTIADPKYVWARLDAYESDYPWIRIGQRVTFITEAYPGEVFEAKVVYIDPVFDPATRTFSIGAITTEDQGGRLKSGMLVRATTYARLNTKGNLSSQSRMQNSRHPLVIPASAPLITGKRAVVYVAVPGDHPVFEGREVILGPRAGDHYVVHSGLSEGEQVVTNGNFKIDSAMQILAKPSLMAPNGGMPMTGHEHHGMEVQQQPGQTGEGKMSTHTTDMDHDIDHPEAENSLADEHQHPDLSGPMHDDYEHARHQSRLQDASEKNDRHHYEPRGVVRRKPGQYGDTTRQGASHLEKHRNSWRKSKQPAPHRHTQGQ